MRKIFFVCLFAIAGMTSRAQDPRRHRDTLHFGQGGLPAVMRAPVLTGQTQPVIIVPQAMEFCFTKEIDLKMQVGGRQLEQTVYLDVDKGLSGILPPALGGGADILPELEHFSFTVMSMKGNIYVYKTNKSKNGLEHWVSTGNTQSFLYQSPQRQGSGLPGALARKSDNRSYCGGQIMAQAYKFDGGASTWYMYGSRFPTELHPVKYLGAFGVGYLFCQEGLYLIMEVVFPNSFVRIADIYNMHACFNPSEFVVMEDRFQQKQQEEIQHERAKNNEEAAKVTGDCAAEKMAVINFKQAMNDKHAEIMRKVQRGNMYNDTAAQRAMLSLNDPEDNCRLSVLSAEQSICGARAALSKNPRDPDSYQRKIQCLQDQVRMLTDAVAQMEAIDRQYATHPEIAGPQKSRLYLNLLNTMPHCD